MAVYFKYKSAKDYDSIPILDRFISVGNLKLRIFESKPYGKGKDFDLLITNAQTKQDYVDHGTLIPRNTSVLIRRVPGLPRLPIVVTEPKQVCDHEEVAHSSISAKYSQDFECDDFGDDVYAIPKLMPPIQSGNPVATGRSTNDEDTKIKNLIGTPGLSNGCDFGRVGKPPLSYVCHRCNVPGHFIQHCPTNGDPNYDIKKVKLMATPSSIVGVLKPKEEVERMSSVTSSSSSKRSFRDIPPELHCPLCKGLMKDAVIASKCCFSSFCDKCIRDHIIISNSVCICGARNILADALLPNMTLRVTINRVLKSSSSSSEHEVNSAQYMASTHITPGLKTVEECPLAVEQRKKSCDVAAVNKQYMSCGLSPIADIQLSRHVSQEEAFRGRYVETSIAVLGSYLLVCSGYSASSETNLSKKLKYTRLQVLMFSRQLQNHPTLSIP
ncbi:E3 ubiquitin-protein ligase rbbp6 [Datura stramonium]|uniref:E3 ubiquitin-protein ligase rbbp6 n=1 Tax=Datura stramonium TaxID=4076 RepID=A0ABS8T0F9_DATST|nr:E3 ubiquitin-protein ligase rbbp6 [Datura stramonium]